jgi:ABC-2 type transport system ATP-binding protein
MIEAQGLTRVFGATVAVDCLDLAVKPGEIFGFLGPNGAGKSTTVKMLTGLLEPSGGSARVAGYDVLTQSLEVKRRIGYVPETGALYENLTASEYLELIACLHHLTPEAAGSRIGELLEIFDIAAISNKRMTEFSKGMKQKVVLSAALLPNPEVLFLDEPLNGLDANSAMLVKSLLRQMATQGKTVFFSSHILEVVERVCTRIAVINQGRKIVEGTPAEIIAATETTTLEEAFGRLTGVRDTAESTAELLAALERD